MIKLKIKKHSRTLFEARSKWRFLNTVSRQIGKLIFEKLINNPVELTKPGIHSIDVSQLSSVKQEKALQKIKLNLIIKKIEKNFNFSVSGFYATDNQKYDDIYNVKKNSIIIVIGFGNHIDNFLKLQNKFDSLRKKLDPVIKHEIIHYLRTNNLYNYDYKHRDIGTSRLNSTEKEYIDNFLAFEKEEVETYATQAVHKAQIGKTNIEDEINNKLKALLSKMSSKAGMRYYYRFKLSLIDYIIKRWSVYKERLQNLRNDTLINLNKFSGK